MTLSEIIFGKEGGINDTTLFNYDEDFENFLKVCEFYYPNRVSVVFEKSCINPDESVDSHWNKSILILFDDFTIVNSNNFTHNIKDLYVEFQFYSKNMNAARLRNPLSGFRTTLTIREGYTGYAHSHLNVPSIKNIDQFKYEIQNNRQREFCLGDSNDFSDLVRDFYDKKSLKYQDIYKMIEYLDQYVRWESVEGGPYRRMSYTKSYSFDEDSNNSMTIRRLSQTTYPLNVVYTDINYRNVNKDKKKLFEAILKHPSFDNNLNTRYLKPLIEGGSSGILTNDPYEFSNNVFNTCLNLQNESLVNDDSSMFGILFRHAFLFCKDDKGYVLPAYIFKRTYQIGNKSANKFKIKVAKTSSLDDLKLVYGPEIKKLCYIEDEDFDNDEDSQILQIIQNHERIINPIFILQFERYIAHIKANFKMVTNKEHFINFLNRQ